MSRKLRRKKRKRRKQKKENNFIKFYTEEGDMKISPFFFEIFSEVTILYMLRTTD